MWFTLKKHLLSGNSAQSLITTSVCLNTRMALPDIQTRLFLELEHHRQLAKEVSNSLLGLILFVLGFFFSEGKGKDLIESIGQFRQNKTSLSNCRVWIWIQVIVILSSYKKHSPFFNKKPVGQPLSHGSLGLLGRSRQRAQQKPSSIPTCFLQNKQYTWWHPSHLLIRPKYGQAGLDMGPNKSNNLTSESSLLR